MYYILCTYQVSHKEGYRVAGSEQEDIKQHNTKSGLNPLRTAVSFWGQLGATWILRCLPPKRDRNSAKKGFVHAGTQASPGSQASGYSKLQRFYRNRRTHRYFTTLRSQLRLVRAHY